MIAVLQRLVIPVILLAAVIGATIATDRLGNDPIPEASTGVDVQRPDTPVFSIRRAPDLLTSERAVEDLNSSLDGWVATLPPNSCFVVSSGADVIYSHQADLPLTPASNMKILTAVAALQALGVDYTFETRVAALQRPDENGFLSGDLYIIGGGDPLLRSDAYLALLPEGFSDVHTSVEQMADQTVATNIADISGGVRVDETRYDNERAPISVPGELLDAALLGALGGAIVDQGFVGLEDGYASQIVEEPEPGAVDENGDPLSTPEPPPLPRSDEPAREFAARFD
ncbi:MAG: D-alanyl-D-alanine carboxypeptidase, partial [Actinomycetota bacterium]